MMKSNISLDKAEQAMKEMVHLLGQTRQASAHVFKEGAALARVLTECVEPYLERDTKASLKDICDVLALAHEEFTKPPETVLAVTGIMKAGKSTTINALVGMEIIPSRNTPMTAIPTRVRHTPGATTPHLSIPCQHVCQEMLESLKARVQQGAYSHAPDSHESRIVQGILEWDTVPSNVSGAELVWKTLACLHDLLRLANIMDLPVKYDAFYALENLPLVEVEFAQLPVILSESQAGLTLLDTPGGNEYCQGVLGHLAIYWLNQVAGLLLIVDYTQIRSEADAKLRAAIAALPASTARRLYVLVNKFDQHRQSLNNMDEEETTAFVQSQLLQGMEAQVVQPIASRSALLASLASQALRSLGSLPDKDVCPWVGDFAEQAFGLQWKKYVQDSAAVEEGIDLLRKESNFFDLLHRIIVGEHFLSYLPPHLIQLLCVMESFWDNIVHSFTEEQMCAEPMAELFKRFEAFYDTSLSRLQDAYERLEAAQQNVQKCMEEDC